MLGGHPQRGHPLGLRGLGGEQGGDVASCRGLNEVSGAGCEQNLYDVGHPEHCCVPQRGASGNATSTNRRGSGQVGSRFEEDLRDLGIAVAGGSHQRCLGVGGITIDGRSGFQQRSGDGCGAGHVSPDAARGVIAQHGDVAQRARSLRVVTPGQHRLDGQFRVLGE